MLPSSSWASRMRRRPGTRYGRGAARAEHSTRLCGDDRRWPEYSVGRDGCISVTANVAPRLDASSAPRPPLAIRKPRALDNITRSTRRCSPTPARRRQVWWADCGNRRQRAATDRVQRRARKQVDAAMEIAGQRRPPAVARNAERRSACARLVLADKCTAALAARLSGADGMPAGHPPAATRLGVRAGWQIRAV